MAETAFRANGTVSTLDLKARSAKRNAISIHFRGLISDRALSRSWSEAWRTSRFEESWVAKRRATRSEPDSIKVRSLENGAMLMRSHRKSHIVTSNTSNTTTSD